MHGTGLSTMTAYTAHREWTTRPPDERFDSVQALYQAARTRRLSTEERRIETVEFSGDAFIDRINYRLCSTLKLKEKIIKQYDVDSIRPELYKRVHFIENT